MLQRTTRLKWSRKVQDLPKGLERAYLTLTTPSMLKLKKNPLLLARVQRIIKQRMLYLRLFKRSNPSALWQIQWVAARWMLKRKEIMCLQMTLWLNWHPLKWSLFVKVCKRLNFLIHYHQPALNLRKFVRLLMNAEDVRVSNIHCRVITSLINCIFICRCMSTKLIVLQTKFSYLLKNQHAGLHYSFQNLGLW